MRIETNKSLESIISKSQRCQRNWDLTRQVTEEDLQTLKTAVTNCPSKQNVLFYKVVFIQNREIIEKIHKSSDCYAYSFEPRKDTTNPQILANTICVFVRDRDFTTGPRTHTESEKGIVHGKEDKDEYAAVGIAAGYLNLTAHMLGYKTGFYNAQHGHDTLSEVFGKEYIFCMLGIGYPDETKHRRDHHLNPTLEGLEDFRFNSLSKEVHVEEWK
tara:strand:- start:875 stop:1519 length:645 start_codon:yes stop_codon:yes gene_type:complete